LISSDYLIIFNQQFWNNLYIQKHVFQIDWIRATMKAQHW